MHLDAICFVKSASVHQIIVYDSLKLSHPILSIVKDVNLVARDRNALVIILDKGAAKGSKENAEAMELVVFVVLANLRVFVFIT